MSATPLKAMSLRDSLAKTVRLLIKDGIEVSFRGSQPYVAAVGDKAVRLVLPELNDDASPELLAAIQGFLDHEVGHILYTPFGKHAAFGKGDYKRKAMLNIIEDIRLEKLLPRDLPGTKENLERMYESAIPTLWGPSAAQHVTSPEKGTRFSAVIIIALRALSGQKPFHQHMDDNDYWQHFQPLLDVMPTLSRRLREMETSQDAISLAEDILTAIDNLGIASKAPIPDPHDDEEDKAEKQKGDKGKPEQTDDADADEQDADTSDDAEGGEPEPGDDAEGDDADGEPGDGEAETDEDGEEEEGGGEGHGDGSGTDDESDEESGDCSGDGDEANEDEDGDQKKGKSKSDDGDQDDDSSGTDSNTDADGESDSDDTGKGGKTNFTITDALKMLEARQRRALFLYRKRKQTIAQIAVDMDASEEEVAELLRNGRRRLGELLSGDK